MKYFVVTNEHGSAWNESRSLIEQEGWAEHAAFMNKLVDEGFIVLGGPIGDGSRPSWLSILTVSAPSGLGSLPIPGRGWDYSESAKSSLGRSY